MSLQELNDEVEGEITERENAGASPFKGAFQKLKINSLSTRLRGEYPTPQKLEELLLELETQ